MKNVTDSAKVGESSEIAKQDQHDDFFTKDNITISVLSVYRNHNVHGTADRLALLTQLKLIAKSKGYNVSESESNFTRTKYIHFKKYRLQTEAPPPPAPEPKAEDVVIDAENVKPALGS